ncbi:MAG TPA: RICIN domain-containing protein [Pyrinomonadaceae bacterium]|nr:RICIN domain-containing protein [Pyrinomonadaceae bacterium]
MKTNVLAVVLALLILLLVAGAPILSAGAVTAPPGNIADGMYTIVGEASHRCLEIASNSCAAVTPLEIFDCDKSGASNNQKFNVASDGSGNYTVSPVHSDLCLEVSADNLGDRTMVVQAECVNGKASQKWSMNQFGVNLEIRDVGSNRCLDIMRKGTGNFAPIYLLSCNNGPNQRWRLQKTTINIEQGVICRESPAHPARSCSGVNDQQKEVSLGKTLTRTRCDDVCKVNKMVSCRWDAPQ